MSTDAQKKQVREMIDSFFRFAGVTVPWNGEVNDGVAAVFDIMLRETAQCTKAFNLVPRPPAGPASVSYLAMQLGGAIYRRIEGRLSVACAKDVIRNFRTPFDLATQGVATAARYGSQA